MQIFISPSLWAHFLLSVIASALSLFRHCERTFFFPSLRGHLCPWQSPAWSKYGNYTVLMSEIASSLRSSQWHCKRSLSLRAHFLFSVIARAFMPVAIPCMEQVLHCHCEGACARGNPRHGASTVTTPSSCLRLLRRYAPRNDIVVSLSPNHLIITCPLKIVRKCTKCKYYASPCLNMAFSYKTDKFSVGAKIGHSEFSY